MSYTEKFKGFIKAIKQAKADKAQSIIIQSPYAIGDNYEEIVESLNRIASAGLSLSILPPDKQSQAKTKTE